MSFFDEVDEPPRTEPRTTPRAGPRGRRPSGPRGPRGTGGSGGRRPSGGDQQTIQLRRAGAIVVIIIVIVLIAVLVHGCQVNATNSALQNYTNSVSSLNQQSAANGRQLFTQLGQASGASSPITVQQQVNQVLHSEQQLYQKAQGLSVPDQVKTGNADFQRAMKMRVDGLTGISKEIQPALSSTATKANVNSIAEENAKFYASDVLYKSYALPEIASALNAAGTHFSPPNGDQFLTSIEWLSPTFVASTLHVNVPGSQSTKVAPGLHGHSLTSVSVGTNTLQEGVTNTVAANPIPTFTLDFNNGGTNNEHNVRCSVKINGTSVTGTGTVPETFAGKNATCTA